MALQVIVITAELAVQGSDPPQLTTTVELVALPEHDQGPAQVAVGTAQVAPEMIETLELLKFAGNCDGATQA